MARKSTTTPAVVTPSGDDLNVTISQQALNLLHQIVGAQGWAKAIKDIFLGGKLLAETLPPLDSLAWVRSAEQIKAMLPEERKSYLLQDEEWGAKLFTFTVTSSEREAVERAFQHFAATAASAKQLGPNKFLYELIVALSIKDAPLEVDAKSVS